MSALIKLESVSKYYKTKTGVSEGMRQINLEFNTNEFVAITGESGSGKTTLLNVISGLDSYEDGELYINGNETSHFTVKEWEEFRAKHVGFVFQNYNVIDSYTVYQNVIIALEAQGYDSKKKKQRALELIDKVGLTSHKNQRTAKLSGGQKQRVVIARALAKNAPIILADEPTGNLDTKSGKEIMELLKEISQEKLIILVTHNYEEAKAYVTRNVVMKDGAIQNDFAVSKTTPKEYDFKDDNNNNNKPINKSFFIALRNILSTPKRTIFMTMLSMVVIVIFVFFYSLLIKEVVGNIINDDSLNRAMVEVQKRDSTEFTEDDLNELDNALLKDSTYFPSLFMRIIEIHNYDSSKTLFNDASVLWKKEIEGRYPKTGNEVIAYNDEYGHERDARKIGDVITFLGKSYTVVGTTYQVFTNHGTTDYYYFHKDELIQNGKLAVSFENYLRDIASEAEINGKYKFDVDGYIKMNSYRIRGTDRRSAVIAKERLDIDKYRVIDTYLQIENEFMFIIGTILVFMWAVLIVILLIVFLVIYHVQKNMMENRKKDFAVYRSIGITEKEVGTVVLFEQLIVAVAATIVSIASIMAISDKVHVIGTITRNVTISDYLIIAIVFAIFSLMLGLRYNKKVFNVTVIESLKEDF